MQKKNISYSNQQTVVMTFYYWIFGPVIQVENCAQFTQILHYFLLLLIMYFQFEIAEKPDQFHSAAVMR